MAKTRVRISLATKFRVLFAAAMVVILAAALGVPWYFTERLADDTAEQSAEAVSSIYLGEWVDRHQEQPRPPSLVARYFTLPGHGRRGPTMLPLTPTATAPAADDLVRLAEKSFRQDSHAKMLVFAQRDERGEQVYRVLRAVRASGNCRTNCHDGAHAPQFKPDQLVGLIDLTMPPPPEALTWWTRGSFILGGLLAGGLAFVTFYVITRQIILTPVRRLHDLADQVAEGDLTKRVNLTTGDELEKLGRRFNEMLDAINTQQEKLRQANQALDLKLHEMTEANVALFETNRIKNEFLANVSHELRTPLNSIIGFAELLSDTEDEKRRRHAHHILTSSRMLLGIINDLLDLARIEAGKVDLRWEKLALSDLCETLVALIRPLAEKKNLQLDLELSDALPVIRTDAGKTQQILYNLLSNAVKFTPAGGKITLMAVSLANENSPLQCPSVALSVSDTGPGIPLVDQQRIFEKFHRLDSSITREHSGAGLGLAISKELTALLGGRLTLQSTPGSGATFTLTLPLDIDLLPEPTQPRK